MNSKLKILLGIVAVVLAIPVVAILIVSISRERAEYAKGKAAEAQLSSFAMMADIYHLDTNEYPESLDNLVRPPSDVAGCRGPYSRRGIPLHDPWGQPYRVERGERGDKIYVRFASDGPDGKPETEDDIEEITDKFFAKKTTRDAVTESDATARYTTNKTAGDGTQKDGMEASAEDKKLMANWYGNKPDDEKIIVAKNHINSYLHRAEMYRVSKGHFPKTIEDLELIPDPWERYYRVEPKGSDAVRIASNGPDQTPHTDDDIEMSTDEGSAKNATRAHIEALCLAAEVFRLETGRVAESIGDISALRVAVSPPQDLWGNPIHIMQLDATNVKIASNGPDGEPNTNDDIESSTNESVRKRAPMVVIRKHQAMFIDLALKFFKDTGEHPKSLEDFLRRPEHFVDSPKWRGPYLKQIPKDPWGNEYRITMSTSGAITRPKFDSDGPDGKPGTEDDIEG